MAKVKQLVQNDKYIYPVTLSSAIKDVSSSPAINLEQRLENIENSVVEESNKLNLKIDSLSVPYKDEYLTFQLLEEGDGEILYLVNEGMDTPLTVLVSTDKINWRSVTAGTSVQDESCWLARLSSTTEKIYIKGVGLCALDGVEQHHRFACTGQVKLKVSGNLASLVNGDKFKAHIKLQTRKFCGLFKYMNTLVDASNLILDDIAIYTECFARMFEGCENLIQGPDLLDTDLLTYDSHAYMFKDCTSLRYIKCLAQVVTEDPFTNWVQSGDGGTDDIGDYSDTPGVFVVNDAASGWQYGPSGVPSGWTIVSESDYQLVRRYELSTPGIDIQDLYARLARLENLVLAMTTLMQVDYSGTVSAGPNAVQIACTDLGSDGGKLNGPQSLSFNIPLVGFVSNGVNTYNIDFTTDITYDLANAKIYNAGGHYDNDNNIIAFNSAMGLTPNQDSDSIYYKMPVLTLTPNYNTAMYKLRNDCVLIIPMTYSGHGTELNLEVRVPLYLIPSN